VSDFGNSRIALRLATEKGAFDRLQLGERKRVWSKEWPKWPEKRGERAKEGTWWRRQLKAAWRKGATRRVGFEIFKFGIQLGIAKGRTKGFIRSGRCHLRQNASLGSTSLSTVTGSVRIESDGCKHLCGDSPTMHFESAHCTFSAPGMARQS
jgi:hypothetical protein